MRTRLRQFVLLCAIAITPACGTAPNTNSNRVTPSPDPKADPTPTVPATLKAGDAVERGVAQVDAQGESLTKMSVTVTSVANTTITLPAGTVFLSLSDDTQNMISAGPVQFVFTHASEDSPEVMTRQIDVFCINRFRHVPTPTSDFAVSYSEETNPVRKLVHCLSGKHALQRPKQLAVWMVSDDLLSLTQDELVNKFLDEAEARLPRASTGAELAEVLLEQKPETPPEVIELIRNASPEYIEAARATAHAELRKQAEEEVREYLNQAGPLLTECGYDLSNSTFFHATPSNATTVDN